MNRRRLLRCTLTALFTGALLPGLTQARPRTLAPPTPILLQRSPLAGFQYHQGPRLWPQLQPGQPLTLTREPANPYDPRAVRIDWNGATLGYLPRIENTAVAQLLDRGQSLSARIAALTATRDPWQRIALEVYLTAGPAARG